MTAPTKTAIPLEALKQELDAILDKLAQSGEPVELEADGQVVAVIMSPEDYQDYRKEKAWNIVRKVQARNAHRDPDEVYREVTAVVEEVRQERYEEWLKTQGRS